RQQLSDQDPWPTGFVRREALKGQPMPSYKSVPIEVRGPKGPYYQRSSLELDHQQQSLVGRDGLGRERWRISLVDRMGDLAGRSNHAFDPAISQARVDGHLMLVSLGVELVALDTIGTPGRQGPRVLWRQDLADTLPSSAPSQGQRVNLPWGPARFVSGDNTRRLMGNTGPLTDGLACFLRQRSLVAVDPLSGHVLWTRSGIQPGSDVIGDDELLFVTAPGSQQALVLRALDGSELGHRDMPAPDHRLAVLGRRVVAWDQAVGSQAILKMRDVWENRDLWKYTFDAGATHCPVDDQAVGVLDRQGHFVVVSLADGKRTIDSHLTPDPALKEIFIFRTPTRDLLVASGPPHNRANESIQPLPGTNLGRSIINGFVHGFDRHTGKHVYSTRLENVGMLLHQPADLPLLTFAAQVQQTGRLGQISKAVIKCVDKRTGRIVVDEHSTGPMIAIEQTGDPEHHQVLLKTTRTSLRLTFTNEAWPAKVDPAAGAGLPSRAGRTLLRGMQKWLEGQVPGGGGVVPVPAR
ncbi:MAG TPA: PQQ-binding-like beta-propeller repeat protein, partial [Pirellulales bacterium]